MKPRTIHSHRAEQMLRHYAGKGCFVPSDEAIQALAYDLWGVQQEECVMVDEAASILLARIGGYTNLGAYMASLLARRRRVTS